VNDKDVLCLDVGNTNLKWSEFRLQDLYSKQSGEIAIVSEIKTENLDEEFAGLEVVPVWVSHVASEKIKQLLIDWFKKNWGVVPQFVISGAEYCGLINSYNAPQDLGVDRWMAMLAGMKMSKNDVCIIDAGTAVTLDVIDRSGNHQGGVIMPGKLLMHQSLINNTSNIKMSDGDLCGLANNTSDAVSSGVIACVLGGVERVLDDVRVRYPEIEVIITGGDACLFRDNGWMEVSDLVLKGVGLVAQK